MSSTTQQLPLRPARHDRLALIRSSSRGDPSVNVVVVPDLGTKIAARSSLGTWEWLNVTIPAIAADAQILAFDMSFSGSETPVWQSILQSATDLLDGLVAQGSQHKIMQRPLLFICHGYGGVVVKRVFNVVHEQYYDPRLQKLINVQSGAMFLGTPHPTYKHKSKWLRLSLLLRCTVKLPSLLLVQAETEAATIANISARFEELGVDIPLASVFETRKTKISGGLFKSSRRELLVDRDFAEISSRHEKLIPADADHTTVCNLTSNTEAMAELTRLIQSGISQQLHITAAFEDAQVTIPSAANDILWASTASDVDRETDSVQGISNLSPPAATKGSTELSHSSYEIIPTVSDFVKPKTKPILPCYLLDPHSRNTEFYGREDVLRQIDDALLPGSPRGAGNAPNLNSFVISGIGGVGKTQITIEYAFTRQDRFDAIFWVNADETGKLAERFNKIAISLRLSDAADAGDRVVTRNLVMEWLSTPGNLDVAGLDTDQEIEVPDVTWLLIFDNADNPELLRDYWPIGGRGSVLVTSRDPLTKTYLNADSGVNLEGLSIPDAAKLLQKLTNQMVDEEENPDLAALASRVQGLPLALSQVAAMIRRQDLTFKEFRDTYKDTAIADLHEHALMPQNDRYRHNLSTVWALGDLGQPARNLLDLLALLDPDKLTESILLNAISHVDAQNFFARVPDYVSARTDLMKSSLLKRDRDIGQISLHRLVQESAMHFFGPGRLNTMFVVAVDVLYHTWPYPEDRYNHNPKLFEEFEKVLDHIVKLKGHFESHLDLEIPLSTARRLSELLQQGGWYLRERGNFDEALSMFQVALSICEKNSEDMPELHADVLFCMSSTLAEHNEAKEALHYAQRHFEQRMIVEKKMPKLSLYGALAYSELGLAQMLNAMYEESVQSCEASREIAFLDQEFLDGDYWPYFGTIHLAFSLSGLNRHQEANRILEETVAWGDKKYGTEPNSFKPGYALQALAHVKEKLGYLDESFEAQQRAFKILRATMGSDYHRTGNACLKMAEHHARRNELETANIYFEQTLKIFKNRRPYRGEYCRALYKAAQFNMQLGNNSSADDLLKESFDLLDSLVPSRDKTRAFTESEFDTLVSINAR